MARRGVRLTDVQGATIDSDPCRTARAARGIIFTSLYRANRTHRRVEDRRLRTYKDRWIVDRTIAWFGAVRRLVVRDERDPNLYLAFYQFAAALIVRRRLCSTSANWRPLT